MESRTIKPMILTVYHKLVNTMQIKIRYAIAAKEFRGSYIKKSLDGLTTDLDKAMTFSVLDDAEYWLMKGRYSPVDKTLYKINQIEVTKRDLEEEPYVQQK